MPFDRVFSTMKTVSVRELRNYFGKVAEWIDGGETVQILKRGRPFARLVPASKAKSFLGCMEGTGIVPDDVEQPLGLEWDAMGRGCSS
jgi:antitoxin (DNA-binding transcriptional repressor) of toxin-antitoxin stability system